jgi:RNA polymerase sigma-70 factor (ECF subfamily)
MTCDADDLTAACRGDETAFTRLFRAHQPLLLRYLRPLAGAAHEDVAAETWVQVVRGLRDFDGDLDGFRGWLFTIAHRRWVDHLRAESRRPPRQDEAAALDLPAGERVDEVVETILSTERAVDLIGRLAPDQAEVVLLRVVADLDVAATARVVGKSRGAVRVLTHRGLRRLATLLEREPVRVPDPDLDLALDLALDRQVVRRDVTRRSRSSVTGES